ncbi:MAG TPA: hypothetical protein VLM40_10040 [Gemmata sp.]|nr:hypothetical protein [Gemmata sp.]
MMMLRCLIAALALTSFATDSEAGPFRRRAHQSYQPAYQWYPLSTAVDPSSNYVSYYSPPSGSSGESGTATGVIVGDSGITSTPATLVDGDGLDEVNAKRAALGLRPYIRDENLYRAAKACAEFRAQYLLFGHTGNDFAFLPAGSDASSAGCAAYPVSYGWMSCCVYDNYTYAGAAWVTGRDGRRFMHLFVR